MRVFKLKNNRFSLHVTRDEAKRLYDGLWYMQNGYEQSAKADPSYWEQPHASEFMERGQIAIGELRETFQNNGIEG